MIQDIKLSNLLEKQAKEAHTLIDVRSPKEYEEATIPGSINIPVFTDEERAEVGTLYKQVSQEAAKKRGLEIFSAKLPMFINEFKQIHTPMTVFCWRGGMRSTTAATVLDLMDIHAFRLEGGIRSYRQWVVSELEKKTFTPDLYVLNGHTGCGKTIMLDKLEEKGYPVIDLEKIANHRGSIFGQIGLAPHKQKKFESFLVQVMHQYANEPFVFIEGESKRIGKATLPDFFYEKKENSLQLFIELPFERRVDIILDEYHPSDNPEMFLEAFHLIKKHIQPAIANEIEQALQDRNYRTAVKLLLEHYYDPRYDHHGDKYETDQVVSIDAATINDAIEQVEDFIANQQ